MYKLLKVLNKNKTSLEKQNYTKIGEQSETSLKSPALWKLRQEAPRFKFAANLYTVTISWWVLGRLCYTERPRLKKRTDKINSNNSSNNEKQLGVDGGKVRCQRPIEEPPPEKRVPPVWSVESAAWVGLCRGPFSRCIHSDLLPHLQSGSKSII